jgi:NADP-dependent 3-hydroxy acid dehydrogenase YdfG
VKGWANDMAGLDGRVVIITGAGSGLGREYALSVSEPPTVDELTKRWSEIADLTNVELGANPLG